MNFFWKQAAEETRMNDLEIKQTKEISDANQPLEMIETSKKKRAKQ